MSDPVIIPTIREGLVVRELTLEDAPAYLGAVDYDRAHLSQFNDNTGTHFQQLEQVEAAIKSAGTPGRRIFGIWEDERFAGSAYRFDSMLEPGAADVGYWLDERFTGRGLASLAVNAIARQITQDSSNQIFASVFKGNEPSERVLYRAGFNEFKQTELYSVYRFQKAAEKAISAAAIYADEDISIARVRVEGRSRAAINHQSTTAYRLTEGSATMVINGRPQPMSKNDQLVIPAGTPYWDSSPHGATFIATSRPPYNPAKVEYQE